MPKRKPPMVSNGRGAHCTYCARRLEATGSASRLAATRDHVHPKSKGGGRRVWCCRQCNVLKRDMTAYEWTRWMAKHPEWWKVSHFQVGTNHRPRIVIEPTPSAYSKATERTG